MTQQLTAAEAARGPVTDKFQWLYGFNIEQDAVLWKDCASYAFQSPTCHAVNLNDQLWLSNPVRLVPIETASPAKETP